MRKASRRRFIEGAGFGSAAGVLGGYFGSAEWTSIAALAQGASPDDRLDAAVMQFWDRDVRRPSENFIRRINTMGTPGVEPEFVFFDSTKQEFQARDEVDEKRLLEKGAARATLRVNRLRLSTASQARFERVQTGTLRIDVKQTAPLPGLMEVLAWSAVAAIVPDKQNKLPPLPDLKFDPGQAWGQLHEIPLTNGIGFCALNFFLKEKSGLWGQIVNGFRTAYKVSSPVFGVFGLPAIAATSLAAIDRVFGLFQASGDSDWIFKSTDTPFVATREAKQALGAGVLLVGDKNGGDYVVLPREAQALKTFEQQRSQLALVDGYLVPKGTTLLGALAAAEDTLPGLDYLSLHVNVSAGVATGAEAKPGGRAAEA